MSTQSDTGLTRAVGNAGRRELTNDYWITLTRTADLVRKLTSLADRYDSVTDDGGSRAVQRRASVALLRTTAEAGRRLVRSLELSPPVTATPPAQQASAAERADRSRARDVRAAGRDAVADGRDERAAHRDVAVRRAGTDGDAGFPGRYLSACDRDDAAGDRAAALADRRAAAADRVLAEGRDAEELDRHARTFALITRLEEREIVRQAQGVLMARAGISAGEALEALLVAAMEPLADDGVVERVLQDALRRPEQEGS